MQYGPIWENKLKEYFKTKKYRVSKLGEIMGCQSAKITRLACIWGYDYYCKNKAIKEEYDASIDEKNELKIEHMNKIKKYISENKGVKRSDISKACTVEYVWLKKHYRDLLESILPLPVKLKYNKKMGESSIDWKERDESIFIEVGKAINEIKSEEKPRRVTILAIARQIGYMQLNNYLDKLPKTETLLKQEIETSKQFIKRKIDSALEKIIETNDRINKSNIKKQACIGGMFDKDIENYIEKAIEEQRD
jgi:hypothetical protein